MSILPIDLLSPSSETMDRSAYYWQYIVFFEGMRVKWVLWEWRREGFLLKWKEIRERHLEKSSPAWKILKSAHQGRTCSTCVLSHSECPTLCDPVTAARQPPLSMGFSKQEYWSGLPFPIPGDLPNPGIKPMSLSSPALAGGFFTTSATWEAWNVQFSSVTQSGPTLRPHGLQHARLPCPSPTPGACSNSCPLSWWCHPTISTSVTPFSYLQFFPASGSYHQVAKVLEFQFQYQSFQWIFRTGEGNGKPLQYSCLENSMNSMKKNM